MLQLPAGREASGDGGSVGYERHRPERTLLYQLVEAYSYRRPQCQLEYSLN